MQHPVGQVPPLRHIQCIRQAPGIKSFSLLSKEITNTDDSWTRNIFFSPNNILILLSKIALDVVVVVLMRGCNDGLVQGYGNSIANALGVTDDSAKSKDDR